jgi:hypothetical protein
MRIVQVSITQTPGRLVVPSVVRKLRIALWVK